MGAAHGMVSGIISAAISEMAGATTKNALLAPPGMTSSLRMFLSPSASGWKRPFGPARLGPMRSWIHAAIHRSSSVA